VGRDHAIDDEPVGRSAERGPRRGRRKVATDHEPLDRRAIHRSAFERSRHAAIAQHDRAIGDRQHFVEVVGNIDDGHAAPAQLVKHREEAVSLPRTQARGRFVEDQDARVRAEGLRDLDQLPLGDRQAAAERRWIQIEAHAREPPGGFGMHRPQVEPAEAVVLAAKENRTCKVKMLRQVQFLVHKRDANLRRLGHAAQAQLVRMAVLIDLLNRA